MMDVCSCCQSLYDIGQHGVSDPLVLHSIGAPPLCHHGVGPLCMLLWHHWCPPHPISTQVKWLRHYKFIYAKQTQYALVWVIKYKRSCIFWLKYLKITMSDSCLMRSASWIRCCRHPDFSIQLNHKLFLVSTDYCRKQSNVCCLMYICAYYGLKFAGKGLR